MEDTKAEAIKQLRNCGIRPGATIFCKLEHVSRSGMFRRISFYTIKKGELLRLNYPISILTGYKMDRSAEGLRVSGCGMDMGFVVVYNLGRRMFPKGGSLKHSPRARQERERGRETNGGYLLRHHWI